MAEKYTQDFIDEVKGSLDSGIDEIEADIDELEEKIANVATDEDIEAIIDETYVESEEESNG